MKGIVVTQEILNKNDFRGAVGQIVVRDFPQKFWVTERVVGGYPNRLDLHPVDGWKEVVTPAFDSAIEKLGARIYDDVNDVITREVIPLTQQEIDDNAQAELDNDAAQQLANKRKEDGVIAYDRVMAIIERKFRDGTFGGALAKGLTAYFDEALNPIYRGIWIIAKDNLTTPPATGNADALQLYNQVVTRVDDYVQNNY